MEIVHYPVLHKEVLEYLDLSSLSDPVLIDATTGEGGHSALFLEKYPSLTVYGLDRDSEIQKKAIKRFECYGNRFRPVNIWFDEFLRNAESSFADAILFDLGISMFHYVESQRGFSFSRDEKLDMRLDLNQKLSAYDIVNYYSEEDLADVIYRYGEERYSRRISSAICLERKRGKIESCAELASLIARSVPKEYRYGKINPATRTFQALRIETNKELDRISPSLEEGIRVLKSGGRIAVITFHSLEDRIVKWFFKNREKEVGDIRILTKKPVVPTKEEDDENAASRSSKLRVIEKC